MFDYLNKKPLSYELTVLKKKKNNKHVLQMSNINIFCTDFNLI